MRSRYLFDDTASHCDSCKMAFDTGSVCVSFFAEHAVIEKERNKPVLRFCCASCTMVHLGKGALPYGAGVWMARVYRDVDIDKFPEAIKARVVEAFGIVEQLEHKLSSMRNATEQPS